MLYVTPETAQGTRVSEGPALRCILGLRRLGSDRARVLTGLVV